MPNLSELIYGEGVEEVYTIYPFVGVDDYPSYVYPLNERNLQIIPEDCPYGTYRIGYVNNNKFFVRYIGRSDHQEGGLRARLREHIGEFEGNPYFMYFDAENVQEAYEDECYDFHSFYEGDSGFLINRYHPAKPQNHPNLSCPIQMCDK